MSNRFDITDIPSELSEVLDELTDQYHADVSVDLEQYVHRYPQHEEVIRGLANAIQAIAELGIDPGSEPLKGLRSRDDLPGTLGDFRLLREIGRGGMGVVYEAEQISLGRPVALKVLPFASLLDKRQLERFKNEARAAAMLKHPNIVSVHQVGSDRGVHFYAMELVVGKTLAKVRESVEEDSLGDRQDQRSESSTTSDSVQHQRASAETQVIAQLSTVGSSDQQGFFRDIARTGCQAALALDYAHQQGVIHRDIKPSNLLLDEQGDIHITDFGLARILTEGTVTVSGEMVGTLRYMSPEQVRADRGVVDHRSDVYSLGVTLYEMLAGRPLFESDDSRKLIALITEQEATPLRKVNPKIPADLETIVAKAIEKEAWLRYETAGHLAADLERYLTDKPIAARRPSLVYRVARWVSRNSAVAALLGVLACLLILIAIVAPIVSWQLWHSVNRESEARRAEQETASNMVTVLATTLPDTARALENMPYTDSENRRILENSLEHLEMLLDGYGERADVRYEVARASIPLSRTFDSIGSEETGRQLMNRATKLLEELVLEEPTNLHYRRQLAITYTLTNPQDESRIQKALEQWTHISRTNPEMAYRGMANAHWRLAGLYGQPDRAIEHMKKALAALDGLPVTQDSDAEVIAEYAWVKALLGDCHIINGELRLAEEELRSAFALIEPIEKYVSTRTRARLGRCHGWHSLATVLIHTGRTVEAETLLDRSFREIGDIRRASVQDDWAAEQLVVCLFLKSELLHERGHLQEAISCLRQLVEVQTEGMKVYRANAKYRLGELLSRSGRQQEAARYFAEVLHNVRPTSLIAYLLCNCPHTEFRDAQRALEIARGMALENSLVGLALYRLNRLEEARDEFESRAEDRGAAFDYFYCAMAQHRLGEIENAKSSFAAGLAAMDGIVHGGPFYFTSLEELRIEASHVLGLRRSSQDTEIQPESLPLGIN